MCARPRRASPPEAGKPRAQIYPPLADPAPRGCRVFNAQGHSFNIRPARISDAESICRVHRAAVKAIEGGLYEKRLVTGWADAVTEAVIRTGTAAADTVGFAALYKNTIAALHVHPDFQHNGVGSNLLNRLETVAAAKGLLSLKLNASKNSCPFHQAHGYRILRKAPFALDDTLTLESFEMTKYLV